MGLVNLVPGKVIAARDGIGTVEAAAALRLDVAAAGGRQAGRCCRGRDPAREHPPARAERRRTAPRRATISDRTFLGNVSEYYATLASGQVLRVQTHPLQQFAVGDAVAVEVDAGQCSVFRRARRYVGAIENGASS